jgi:hypothetical protein
LTKAEWLEEGKALGERASTSCWEIGQWIVRGEEQFLDPKPTSKKALRKYYANRHANWLGLIREAEAATNLAEATLRKYTQVVRRGVRVDNLPFAHHIEVQRCLVTNEKGKRQFHSSSAWEILNLAKEKEWKVLDTRAEVQRRFPTARNVETILEKAKRFLRDILMTVDPKERLTFLEAVSEHVEEECTKAVVKLLEANDDPLGDSPY